jgi:ATP-dependent 26S proteasome regulatory subunit
MLKYSELEALIRARYPLLYVMSWEEQRVMREVSVIAERLQKKVFEWTTTRGLARYRSQLNPGQVEGIRGTKDPVLALRTVLDEGDPALFVFKDLHLHLRESAVRRALRDLAEWLPHTRSSVLLLSPVMEIPPELEKDLTVIDYPLPDPLEIAQLLENFSQDIADNASFTVEATMEGRERLVEAALGLTLKEAENVFAKTLVLTSRLTTDELTIIQAEKKQIIRKSGLLDYIESDEVLENVGGLEHLKGWLRQRRDAFGERARRFGLPAPKGVLFVGVQGCGKSLCAKAVANQWNLPLLRLDAGAVFSEYVGQSESNMRRAIKVAESISPVLLWIDEIDKGFAGMASAGANDSGTTARVFASFITWMQEKTSPVFVIATANNVENLPAELLRKGRFDEIFFVDLPSEKERRAIVRIHATRRRMNFSDDDIAVLAAETEGFSGAEIEQSIVAAMFDAFENEGRVDRERMLRAIRETFPLSRTMREQIAQRRAWAEGRARLASAP